MAAKLKLETILNEFTAVNGATYDYSKAVYRGRGKLITIVCKKHGDFTRTVNSHNNGLGCQECDEEAHTAAIQALGPCSVDGCNGELHNYGLRLCYKHYMRHYRNGTTDSQLRATTLTHSGGGYILTPAYGHPLASGRTHIYEHRRVAYDNNIDMHCHVCGEPQSWRTCHVDHLDDDVTNNDVSNLKIACPVCNQQRGVHKTVATWRNKTGVTYKKKVHSMQELADIRGISRHSLVSRLKRMGIDEAMSMPKGPTGPKSNLDEVDYRESNV